MGEALPGGKSRLLVAWRLGCRGSADRSNSDILNRHVLQHNVPPDGPKRTPLACQNCRRRKTKCDSNHPCSTCADNGELCVREPSSMHTSIPGTQSRPIETTEEVEIECAANPIMPNAEDTSPIRLEWNSPMNQSASNSATTPHSPSGNFGTDQDSLRPLTDPLMGIISGINTATFTPNKTPPLYFGESFDNMSFPFDASVQQSSEMGDHFSTDQPYQVHMIDVPTFTPSRSFSGQLKRQASTFENDYDLTKQT